MRTRASVAGRPGPVDQGERDRPVRGVDGNHLIMDESVVWFSVWKVDVINIHFSIISPLYFVLGGAREPRIGHRRRLSSMPLPTGSKIESNSK